MWLMRAELIDLYFVHITGYLGFLQLIICKKRKPFPGLTLKAQWLLTPWVLVEDILIVNCWKGAGLRKFLFLHNAKEGISVLPQLLLSRNLIGYFAGFDLRQCVTQCLFQLALWEKHFLWRRYCGKKQIECGLALSVLLSTTICVITVLKKLCTEWVHNKFWPQWCICACIPSSKKTKYGKRLGEWCLYSGKLQW